MDYENDSRMGILMHFLRLLTTWKYQKLDFLTSWPKLIMTRKCVLLHSVWERFYKWRIPAHRCSTSWSEKLRTNFPNYGPETCRIREANFHAKFWGLERSQWVHDVHTRTCKQIIFISGLPKSGRLSGGSPIVNCENSGEHKCLAKICTNFRKACRGTSCAFSFCRTSPLQEVTGWFKAAYSLVSPTRLPSNDTI